MHYASLMVLLALLQYTWFIARVGFGRGKYGVKAPACSGHPEWERLFRIQQNTLEQLILFIPATYIFAYYLSPLWVVVPGVGYLLGRFIYASAYFRAPEKREVGMILTMASNITLVVGALVALVVRML